MGMPMRMFPSVQQKLLIPIKKKSIVDGLLSMVVGGSGFLKTSFKELKSANLWLTMDYRLSTSLITDLTVTSFSDLCSDKTKQIFLNFFFILPKITAKNIMIIPFLVRH